MTKAKSFGIGERSPWGGFPKVVRNGDLGDLKKEPEYGLAKAGDVEAAAALVERLLNQDTVQSVAALLNNDKNVKLLPVLAEEWSGTNKIPLATAALIGEYLGLEVEDDIVQAEKVSRTDKSADYRLSFNPTFKGHVEKGQKYFIVDDTLTMGGTVASLKGFVENRGGVVVGAMVMTAHEGALELPIKPSMYSAIMNKHGSGVDEFLKEYFNYGLEHLTQGEAGHFKKAQSLDNIRSRIIAARDENLVDDSAKDISREAVGESASNGEKRELSLSSELVSLLESAPASQTYEATLEHYVQAKHEQVKRIESCLESLIEKQTSKLSQLEQNKPGILSLPKSKKAWQSSFSQCNSRVLQLQSRLDSVHEIKDGMGLHSPKLEELATRKMRQENPEMAADWDAMREAERLHKQRQSDKNKSREKEKTRSVRLTQNRD